MKARGWSNRIVLRYCLLQLPALALVIFIVILLQRWLDFPGWLGWGFVGLWALTVADYNRRLKPVSIAQREEFGAMNAGLAEAIAGIQVVKANSQERHEWLRFVRRARSFRDYFVEQGRIQARYWPMLVFMFSWAAAFLHAMLMWRQGGITLGQVVAFMGLVGTLRFPLSSRSSRSTWCSWASLAPNASWSSSRPRLSSTRMSPASPSQFAVR